MGESLRIVVSGLVAQYPLGGVTWDYVQYPVGLATLGHDVYYIEDTGQWPYNPLEGGISRNCDFNVEYLARAMDQFGLAGRWAYRFPWEGEWFGLSDAKRRDIIGTADLVINVSGSLERPEEYRGTGRLAYVDSDPVFTQIKLAKGQADFERWIDAHDVTFSFGEQLETTPLSGDREWVPTRQPILLSAWTHDLPDRGVYTTVMNWTSYKPIEFKGKTYGQKDVELRRFLDLPSNLEPDSFEIAMAAGKTSKAPLDLLRHKGWGVVDPNEVCRDFQSYRQYLQTSRGEWSVAKNGYVVGQPGWFSCRSACYLASGRPVILQDTGFSDVLPVGEGLLSFVTMNEAVSAIAEVQAHYKRHSKAAREIAQEYFDASLVLDDLIEHAMERAR